MSKEARRFFGVLVAVGCLTLPASASATDIWDQNNSGDGSGVFSQQDVPPTNPAPSEVADDFFIPVGGPLTIRGVTVTGHYDFGTATASSVNVRFYQDAGTVPGALVTEQLNIVPAAGVASGDFAIPLSPGVELATGTYWVSVQANGLDYSDEIWDWDNRTLQGITDPAAARTAAIAGCLVPVWAARSMPACIGFPAVPDQMFSLSSTAPTAPTTPAGPSPVVTPPADTGERAAALKKCKKIKSKKKRKKCRKRAQRLPV